MRKFLTVLFAFVLAFTAVFAFAACSDAENDQNGGSNTEQGGNSDGDNNSNSGEDALQPVAMDAFLSGVLQNISEAEGFSITLAATAKGSTSVKVGDGNPISEEVDKTFEGTYAPGADFARQLLALLEKYDLSLTGTVPASADNSGYELILPLTAAELLQTQVVDTVVGFLQEMPISSWATFLLPYCSAANMRKEKARRHWPHGRQKSLRNKLLSMNFLPSWIRYSLCTALNPQT